MMTMKQRRIILKKPLKLCILVFAGLIFLIFPEPRRAAVSDEIYDDYSGLDSFIVSEMKKNLVPGLSMAIFDNQKVVYRKEFGVKSVATNEPIDEHTIFQAASFSKMLTAYAAMILVERGKLALDVPLNQYVKQQFIPDQRAANQITLQMVLNHTSGLSNDSDGNDRQVYYVPGSRFSYSGAGFRYLQQVIEDVAGLPFAEFMDREIFKPLAMKSSSFAFKDEWLPLMASGHEAGFVFPICKKDVNAAYSLLTTPSDMVKFIMEIYRPALLKPATVAQMLRPMVKWRENIYWGLGVGILKSPDEDFFWHWGNNYYYCSLMIAAKESRKGVIIMTNGNTGMKLAGRLAIKIINTYLVKQAQNLDPETFDFIQ